MAGDWIKLEHATPDKPEIVKMSAILRMDQDAVFGKCVRLWIWADQQSVDGNDLIVTEPFIDRLTFCSGFAVALRQVGWLSGRDGRLMIPNFDRHNGQTAKNRAQTKTRVERSRSSECNATSVTKPLPEKRREKTISDCTDEVLIPNKLQTPAVQQAARLWFAHLAVMAPDKVPLANSPQLQAFWAEASRHTAEEFVKNVEISCGRGWLNLRYEDPEKSQGKKTYGSKRNHAQSREQANSDAFETLFASIGGEVSGGAE